MIQHRKALILLLTAMVAAGVFFPGCNSSQSPKTLTNGDFTVHPQWSIASVIYEVNIRQYTPEGTFAAFEEHLPRLKSLGVDILWLMPIHPIGDKNRKGTLGSYYSIRDYKAINPEFGAMDDFKRLVGKAHQMGFKVILDWVANHTAWDHAWIDEHPEWYVRDETGSIISPYDWSDVAQLNFENRDLWAAMADALQFWVVEADIDGYRCDVAGMVPTPFWEMAREELEAIKPVFMLAEAEQPDHHRRAFSMSYAWELHHIMNGIAKGEKNAHDLENNLLRNDSIYGKDAYRMLFITNHDENSWNGTVAERLGDAAKVFAALTFTLPGMPLIYSGQEAGLSKRLRFFEKDTISWVDSQDMQRFYTSLVALKKSQPSLRNGKEGGDFIRIPTGMDDRLFFFAREQNGNRVLCLANLSAETQTAEVAFGRFSGEYKDAFSGEDNKISERNEVTLPAWGYRILFFK